MTQIPRTARRLPDTVLNAFIAGARQAPRPEGHVCSTQWLAIPHRAAAWAVCRRRSSVPAAVAGRLAPATSPSRSDCGARRAALATIWRGAGFALSPAQDHAQRASTSEAYAFLFNAAVRYPYDVCWCPSPSYPLLDVLARIEGIRLARYTLTLRRRMARRCAGVCARPWPESARWARAIVCVNPNNPTGSFLKRDELELLARTGLSLYQRRGVRRATRWPAQPT